MNASEHDLDTTRTRRTAGAMLLCGATLLLVGNIAHPVDVAPSATSRLDLATSPSWVVIHLALGLGMLVVALAIVRLATANRRDGVTAGTVAATTAIVGGGTLGAVFAALDGFGAASLADRWHATPLAERGPVEGAAIALEAIDSGLAGFGTLLLFGAAMLALAAVLVHTRAGSRALTAMTVAAGSLGTITGLALLAVGPTEVTINMMMRPVGGLATITWLALGTSLVRHPEGRWSPQGPGGGSAHGTATRGELRSTVAG